MGGGADLPPLLLLITKAIGAKILLEFITEDGSVDHQ